MGLCPHAGNAARSRRRCLNAVASFRCWTRRRSQASSAPSSGSGKTPTPRPRATAPLSTPSWSWARGSADAWCSVCVCVFLSLSVCVCVCAGVLGFPATALMQSSPRMVYQALDCIAFKKQAFRIKYCICAKARACTARAHSACALLPGAAELGTEATCAWLLFIRAALPGTALCVHLRTSATASLGGREHFVAHAEQLCGAASLVPACRPASMLGHSRGARVDNNRDLADNGARFTERKGLGAVGQGKGLKHVRRQLALLKPPFQRVQVGVVRRAGVSKVDLLHPCKRDGLKDRGVGDMGRVSVLPPRARRCSSATARAGAVRRSGTARPPRRTD